MWEYLSDPMIFWKTSEREMFIRNSKLSFKCFFENKLLNCKKDSNWVIGKYYSCEQTIGPYNASIMCIEDPSFPTLTMWVLHGLRIWMDFWKLAQIYVEASTIATHYRKGRRISLYRIQSVADQGHTSTLINSAVLESCPPPPPCIVSASHCALSLLIQRACAL